MEDGRRKGERRVEECISQRGGGQRREEKRENDQNLKIDRREYD